MSASNSSGIQTLLEAENRAQEVVQEARVFRTQRIKASKVDAAKAIDEYKAKKEVEFKASSSKFENDEGKAEEASSKAAQAEIDELKKGAEKKKADVVKYLVEQAKSA